MRNILLILSIAFLFQNSASADYYRYVDKDGVVRFTEDLSTVPEEYQDKVQHYQFQNSEPNMEAAPSSPRETDMPEDVIEASNKEIESEKTDRQTEKKRHALFKEEKALKAEYDLLMKEKEHISGSIREWTKRYKTRNRKSVARAKVKQLRNLQSMWEKKYSDWKVKKEALDRKLRATPQTR